MAIVKTKLKEETKSMQAGIYIKGARVHNLKNI